MAFVIKAEIGDPLVELAKKRPLPRLLVLPGGRGPVVPLQQQIAHPCLLSIALRLAGRSADPASGPDC